MSSNNDDNSASLVISHSDEKDSNLHPLNNTNNNNNNNNNRNLLPRQPRGNPLRKSTTSLNESSSHCSSSGGSSISIGSKKKGRHRRVLSAVEGSIAQEKLLSCMDGLDLSGLTTDMDPNMIFGDGSAELAKVEDSTEEGKNLMMAPEDDIVSNTDATNNSVTQSDLQYPLEAEPHSPAMTASALSEWNTAAQSKAARVSLPSAPSTSNSSPPEAVESISHNHPSNDSYIDPDPPLPDSPGGAPQWHPDGNDHDGLVAGHANNTTHLTQTNHPHFPILPVGAIVNDGASSVGATAAFSNSSLRSIMSQYSSDLEDDDPSNKLDRTNDDTLDDDLNNTQQEEDDLIVGEEGDLMGELLPHLDRSRIKSKEKTSSCRNCSRMQQLEHQRRMQNETKKISSRNLQPSTNNHNHNHNQNQNQNPPPNTKTNTNTNTNTTQNTNNPYNQILFTTQQHLYSPPPPPPPSSSSSTHPTNTLVTEDSLKKLFQSELTRIQSELLSQNQLHFEKLFGFLQSEGQKRNTIEHRLKHQLLLHSESMVAMELKLLRLEARLDAKVERRERMMGISSSHSQPQPQPQPLSRKTVRSSNTASSSSSAAASTSYRRMMEVETDGEFPLETMILANVEEVDSEDNSEQDEDNNNDEEEDDDDHRNSKLKKIIAASSGASLVSAVTAMSGEGYDGLGEEEEVGHQGVEQEGDQQSRMTMEEDDEVDESADTLTLGTWGSSSIIERTNPGLWNRGRGRYRGARAVVTGIATEDDGSENTPTQSSKRHIPNLESILLNPLVLNNSVPSMSVIETIANTTRATRAPPDPANGMDDENSTLATSVTSATLTSTVVTGATSLLNANTSRGGSHITGAIGEHSSYNTDNTHEDNDQSSKEIIHISLKEEKEDDIVRRDQSNSPLTVPSMSGLASIASSVGTTLATGSMATTAAVAPTRSFRSHRAAAAGAQLSSTEVMRGRDGVIPSHVKTGGGIRIGNYTRRNHVEEEDETKEGEEIASRRSRSNSPLTLPSMSGINSVAPSLTSVTATGIATIGSTVAVAPSRDYRSRRAAAAAHLAASAVNERAGGTTSVASNSNNQPSNLIIGGVGVLTGNPRPLTNRVVSFVHSSEDGGMNVSGSGDMEGAQVVFTGGSVGGILRGEMDDLTVPDELDNLSDIDAAFATSGFRWRDEYEARLDALQKRWSND